MSLPPIIFLTVLCTAQNVKKPLDEQAYFNWNSIENSCISNDGKWVSYEINPGFGDGKLALYQVEAKTTQFFERALEPKFDHDLPFLLFKITPPKEFIDSLRRKKVDEEYYPSDTLAILDLASGSLTKIGNFQKLHKPEKWGGHFFFEINVKPDSIWEDQPRKIMEDEKIIIHQDLQLNKKDTFFFVKDLVLA